MQLAVRQPRLSRSPINGPCSFSARYGCERGCLGVAGGSGRSEPVGWPFAQTLLKRVCLPAVGPRGKTTVGRSCGRGAAHRLQGSFRPPACPAHRGVSDRCTLSDAIRLGGAVRSTQSAYRAAFVRVSARVKAALAAIVSWALGEPFATSRVSSVLAFVVDLPHGFAGLDVAKLQVALALVQVKAFLDTNVVIELGVVVQIPPGISISVLRH